jgi:hypothetical protein
VVRRITNVTSERNAAPIIVPKLPHEENPADSQPSSGPNITPTPIIAAMIPKYFIFSALVGQISAIYALMTALLPAVIPSKILAMRMIQSDALIHKNPYSKGTNHAAPKITQLIRVHRCERSKMRFLPYLSLSDHHKGAAKN